MGLNLKIEFGLAVSDGMRTFAREYSDMEWEIITFYMLGGKWIRVIIRGVDQKNLYGISDALDLILKYTPF